MYPSFHVSTISTCIFRLFKSVLRILIRWDPVFLGRLDPDPGKYRIRILYQQKDPILFTFSRYKIV